MNIRKQLVLTTQNQMLARNPQRLSDVVCALGHETELFETPDGILGDDLADPRGAEASEHCYISRLSCMYRPRQLRKDRDVAVGEKTHCPRRSGLWRGRLRGGSTKEPDPGLCDQLISSALVGW